MSQPPLARLGPLPAPPAVVLAQTDSGVPVRPAGEDLDEAEVGAQTDQGARGEINLNSAQYLLTTETT